MKTLLVMRHAKSAWDNPHHSDHERPLNERGCRDAPLIGHRVAALGLPLDAVVSSDAVRAEQTAELVNDVLQLPRSTTPALYHASVDDWQSVVATFDNDWNGVLAVAHNPGVSDLLFALGGDGHVPTATVLHLRLPDWSGLLDATLIGVLRPSD